MVTNTIVISRDLLTTLMSAAYAGASHRTEWADRSQQLLDSGRLSPADAADTRAQIDHDRAEAALYEAAAGNAFNVLYAPHTN